METSAGQLGVSSPAGTRSTRLPKDRDASTAGAQMRGGQHPGRYQRALTELGDTHADPGTRSPF